MLHLVLGFDHWVYNFFNRFTGNWLLDHIAGEEEMNALFKGGLFVAMYWYFWFRKGGEQLERRRTIVSIVIGTLTALAINRTIAFAMPFRVRPMANPALPHHPFSIPISPNIEAWSAFPSDTATYFFALACGLGYLCPRLKIPAMLYAAVWICVPRLYLGLHYASDILVGAAIGACVIWACVRNDWLQNRVAAHVLAYESRPGPFYAIAFLISFELAGLFDHIRDLVGGLIRAASTGPDQEAIRYALLASALCVAIVAAFYTLFRPRRPDRRPEADLARNPGFEDGGRRP